MRIAVTCQEQKKKIRPNDSSGKISCSPTLAFPGWEVILQAKYAVYLNLIEPWWKVLRSSALKERRFESWQEVRLAVEEATAEGDRHQHLFLWGRRRRQQPRRRPRIAGVPGVG
jgi:hypothetical protein